MVEQTSTFSPCLETLKRHNQLIWHSDEILIGAEDYLKWFHNLLSVSLNYIDFLVAGALVVPQFSEISGIPKRIVIKKEENFNSDIIELIEREFFLNVEGPTFVVDSNSLNIDDDLTCTVAPISKWFDRPIGFFWVITAKSNEEAARVYIEHASLSAALVLRANKATQAVTLLSKPIWAEENDRKQKASELAQACLEALGCSAVLVWEADDKVKPQVLKTLAVKGNVSSVLRVDMPIGSGAAGICAHQNEVKVIDDLLDESELAKQGIGQIRHKELVKTVGWHSAIFAPLDIGGQVAGVFAVYAQRPRAFSELDKNVVLAFVQRLTASYMHIARIEQLTEMEKRLAREAPAIETGILAMEHVHDAYNALGIAQAYIGVIRDRFKREPESLVYKNSENVSRNIDHSLKILRILRDGADITKVRFTKNSLRETIEFVLNTSKEDLEKYKIKVGVNVDRGLYFKYDEMQMQRVIKNFFDNSIFFLRDMPRKDRSIYIKAEVKGIYVKISFLDNGPGIYAGDIPKVFDYLFTTKGNKGMGFGLAISKRIIHNNHKGTIEVRSKWGSEVEFVINLPYLT